MADQTNRIILQGVDNTGPAIASARQNLVGLGSTAEMSAKQTAAAMRMVPAQMTDIVVSLASGQKPLTVLLQQGGQLKDMFGGAVPAAKALGGYLLSLINPVTILAGAAGALAVAYVLGAKESQELNRVLILTGSYAGQTAGSLNEMAKAMSATGKVTRADAVDALVEVVATGKVASGQLQSVAQAALDWAKVTGDSVKTVVGRFVELGEEPAKASAKLNEQYHFLTASVYEQIRALEEQGAKEQAAALAQKTLAEAAKERAKAITENLGFLETAWNGVAKAAKWAWDQMMGIGRDQTGAEQLAAKQQELSIRLQRGAMRPDDPASVRAFEAGNEALRKEIELLQRVGKAQADTAKQAGEAQRAQDAAIGASDRVRALEDQAKGISAVNRELEKYHKDLERIRAANPQPGSEMAKLLDPATIRRTEADIRKRFAGPVPEQTLDARLKEQQGLMAAAERATKLSLERIRLDYELGLTSTKQFLQQEYEARQDGLQKQLGIAKEQERIASGKANIAAVEQYKNEVKKVQDEIKANATKHAADLTVLTAKQQQAISDYERGLRQELRSRQGAIDDALGDVGLTGREREQRQRQRDLQRNFERRREELQHKLELGEGRGGISQETFDKELALEQSFYDQRIVQEQDYNAKSQALREDWNTGAKQAFAEYAESARDAAGQAAKFFGDTLQGMEDAIVEFTMTGKLNFRSLANTVIAEIVRMQAKAAVAKMFGPGTSGAGFLQSIGSFLFPGTAGGAAAIDAGSIPLPLTFAAQGGVFSAKNLAQYSGQVIDRPTIFAFARGGVGVMGEAGKEAVMPLRRGRDGRLGVDAGAQSVNVSIANLGPPIDVVSERRSDGEIELVIDRAVQRSRHAVAQDLADPNSRISRGLGGSYDVKRKR